MSAQPAADPTIVDLVQRLTRLEERFETGDPRVAEALETARAALSRAASAEEQKKILNQLAADLKIMEGKLPRARPIPADDPPAPADPAVPTNNPGAPVPSNAPAPPAPTPAPTNSPSDPPPPARRLRHRSRHGM